jgi:salicylate hydroxylase
MRITRNGLTGEVVKQNPPPKVETRYLPQRVRRTTLQEALKAKVPDGAIKLKKRLVSLEYKQNEVLLAFEDGTETITDLAIGADGIRSVGFCLYSFFPFEYQSTVS